MPTSSPSELRLAQIPVGRGELLVPYELRRSKRSRNMRLTYGADGDFARLTIPFKVREADAIKFLHAHGEWIEERMREYVPPQQLVKHLRAVPWLSVDGVRRDLKLVIGLSRAGIDWCPQSETLCLQYSSNSTEEPQIKQALRDYARVVLVRRASFLAERLGVEVQRFTVRDQSTVWGSCSSKKNISLNWRLLLLSPELQDYIILHELAHIRHMNHSRKFWELLSEYDQRAVLHDRRISEMSGKIMRLGR